MNRRKKLIIVIAAMTLIAVVVLVIAILAKPVPLPAYDVSNDATPAPQSTDTSWGTFFSDQEAGVSLIVPKDFTHIIKSGYNTFVHKASTAYVQIQFSGYNPEILLVDEEYLRNSVANEGGSFNKYTRLSNTSYQFSYTFNGSSYDKYVAFDKDSVIVVEFCTPNEYAQVFNGMGDKILNSVKYNPDSPFPNHVQMCYSSYGNFQYGLPDDWEAAFEDGILYAADPVTGTEMMISVFEDDITFEGYSQVDFVNQNNKQYPKYINSSYYATANELQAIGTYNYNGETRYLIQYMMINGPYVYQLFFTCPDTTYNTASPAINVLVDLFRIV